MVIIRFERQDQGILFNNAFRKEATLTVSIKERKLVLKRFKRKEVPVLTKKIFCDQKITANSLEVRTFGIIGN